MKDRKGLCLLSTVKGLCMLSTVKGLCMLSTVYSLVMWSQEKRPDMAEDVFQLRKCLPSINTGLSSILSTIAPTYNFNNWETGAGESAIQSHP